MKTINNFLFDMDGVVVDSMKHHAGAWKRALNGYNILISDFDIFKREGMSGVDSIKDIFIEKGAVFPGTEVIKGILNYKHDIFENSKISLFPYIKDILYFLKSRNVNLALVTGSLMRSVEFSIPLKLRNLFDVIITADDFTIGKPEPEPYLKAMEKLKCGPEDSIAVENAPLGILSARRAGLECYVIETSLKKEYLKGADKIFPDHISMLKYLKNDDVSLNFSSGR